MMNLNYSQTSGIVTNDNAEFLAKGWAGNGSGKNNSSMQHVHCVGPLPQGVYKIGPWFDHPRLGKMVAELVQIEGETYGRSEFFFHGPSNSPSHYGQESKGCVVIPYPQRIVVKNMVPGPGDTLTVTE